jgi:peroxisomal membrane protein 4
MASSTLSAIESVIKDPKYAEYLALVKGARNGFVYGVKIRFPHALVMAILFGRREYV